MHEFFEFYVFTGRRRLRTFSLSSFKKHAIMNLAQATFNRWSTRPSIVNRIDGRLTMSDNSKNTCCRGDEWWCRFVGDFLLKEQMWSPSWRTGMTQMKNGVCTATEDYMMAAVIGIPLLLSLKKSTGTAFWVSWNTETHAKLNVMCNKEIKFKAFWTMLWHWGLTVRLVTVLEWRVMSDGIVHASYVDNGKDQLFQSILSQEQPKNHVSVKDKTWSSGGLKKLTSWLPRRDSTGICLYRKRTLKRISQLLTSSTWSHDDCGWSWASMCRPYVIQLVSINTEGHAPCLLLAKTWAKISSMWTVMSTSLEAIYFRRHARGWLEIKFRYRQPDLLR